MATTHCPLLNLPAEMRNTIWRYVLVEEDPIELRIEVPPPKPDLLEVSRQIRRETAQIYYQENAFTLKITDSNGAVYMGWQRAEIRKYANVRISLSYSAASVNWWNLRKWLKVWYRCNSNSGDFGPTARSRNLKGFDGRAVATAKMFDAMRLFRKKKSSWREASKYSELMREALEAAKPVEWS